LHYIFYKLAKGVGRKIFRAGVEATEKTRRKHSTIKPLSTLSVPRIKIQGEGNGPAANAHEAYRA